MFTMLQLVSVEHRKPRIHSETLKILKDQQLTSRKVFFVSVMGPARSGKSFLLNFMREKPDILKIDDATLGSVHFKSGHVRDTTGILISSEPIILENADESIAVFLLDTQGCFDTQSDIHESVLICAISLLCADLQVFNIRPGQISGQDLTNLQMFSEYAALFQGGQLSKELIFLLRDVQHTDKYGLNDDLLRGIFEDQVVQSKELSTIVGGLRERFEMHCFCLPYPSERVQNANREICVKDIGDSFREHLFSFLQFYNKSVEESTSKFSSCEHFVDVINEAVQYFSSGQVPETRSAVEMRKRIAIDERCIKLHDEYERTIKYPFKTVEDLQDAHTSSRGKVISKARDCQISGTAEELVAKLEKEIEITWNRVFDNFVKEKDDKCVQDLLVKGNEEYVGTLRGVKTLEDLTDLNPLFNETFLNSFSSRLPSTITSEKRKEVTTKYHDNICRNYSDAKRRLEQQESEDKMQLLFDDIKRNFSPLLYSRISKDVYNNRSDLEKEAVSVGKEQLEEFRKQAKEKCCDEKFVSDMVDLLKMHIDESCNRTVEALWKRNETQRMNKQKNDEQKMEEEKMRIMQSYDNTRVQGSQYPQSGSQLPVTPYHKPQDNHQPRNFGTGSALPGQKITHNVNVSNLPSNFQDTMRPSSQRGGYDNPTRVDYCRDGTTRTVQDWPGQASQVPSSQPEMRPIHPVQQQPLSIPSVISAPSSTNIGRNVVPRKTLDGVIDHCKAIFEKKLQSLDYHGMVNFVPEIRKMVQITFRDEMKEISDCSRIMSRKQEEILMTSMDRIQCETAKHLTTTMLLGKIHNYKVKNMDVNSVLDREIQYYNNMTEGITNGSAKGRCYRECYQTLKKMLEEAVANRKNKSWIPSMPSMPSFSMPSISSFSNWH